VRSARVPPLFPQFIIPKAWQARGNLTAVDLVQEIKRGLLDLLFPPRCVSCRETGSLLCAKCREKFELVEPPLCPHCGRPMVSDCLCPLCQRDPLQIDGVRSVAYFDGTLREAIHRFKYSNLQALAVPLGRLMSDYWEESALPAEVIVPVPLHTDRLRERGYNQAALLARELGKSIGMPVSENSLVRVRATRPQVELGAQERKENVRDAFYCSNAELKEKRILLIDDVCTTGATLEACSMALRQVGARSVWAFTLARVR
jgi:ComF family protein